MNACGIRVSDTTIYSYIAPVRTSPLFSPWETLSSRPIWDSHCAPSTRTRGGRRVDGGRARAASAGRGGAMWNVHLAPAQLISLTLHDKTNVQRNSHLPNAHFNLISASNWPHPTPSAPSLPVLQSGSLGWSWAWQSRSTARCSWSSRRCERWFAEILVFLANSRKRHRKY